MDGERPRHVRPRWPVLTHTRALLPALLPDPGHRAVPAVRAPSPRHAELLQVLAVRDDWPARALHSCLTHLLSSTVTEARRVRLVDAWADGPDALCVVYHPPFDEGRVVGLRRRRGDVLEPGDWRPGDLTTWGYDTGTDTVDGRPVDAALFGRNVADFDLGEPLGFVTTVLRHDGADVGWWGSLEDDLPRPPAG